MKNIKIKNRAAVLLLGTLVLFFAGIIYAWSLFRSPFASLGFGETELSLNFTLTMCTFCLGGLASGLLSGRVSVGARLFAAAVLTAGGFAVTTLTGEGNILPLYLGYGIMAGTGIGIVYNAVISTVGAHFPDKKGIANGVLMMGFGFSTLVIGNAVVKLFDIDIFGWRRAFILLGALLALLIALAALLLAPPEKKASAAVGGDDDIDTRSMLKRASFWKLFVFFMLFAAVGNTAIAGAKGQFEALGAVEYAALLAGLVTVANGLGRIVSGAVFDKFGLRPTQYLTSGVVIAATAAAFAGYALEFSALGIAGLLLCGFSYGFSPTVSAALSAKFYGQKHFALNFPILNLILIPASSVPTLMASLPHTEIFGLLLAFSVAGLVLNITIRKA